MKFTDGVWLLQPGVQAHYPAGVLDIVQDGGALVVTAATRPIRHRTDTLQGPLLTVRVDSPLPDVLRVRIGHFSGAAERGPQVPLLRPEPPLVKINLEEHGATIGSGRLQARVGRDGDWGLVFSAEGRELTRSGPRGPGYMQWPDRGNFIHEQLNLGVGECVYGLGERFTAFVKNGQVVENWNRDGGTGSDQAYKSVPFYLTNRGYGVLVNETGPVSFEVASERVSRVQFSLPGERLEYFLIYGPAPKEILRKLTALTGRPALPPAWSFGLWLSTSFTTNYDEATVTGFIDGMRERDLPLRVFHFDCFWMREFEWCNFQWDARTFPDPAGLLARLHERGLKISVWINPYIAQRSALFAEARQGGFLLRKASGDVWQSDQWQPGMGIVDFTNPAACRWYAGHLRRLLDMGVDCFKTDFGERIPTDVVYHDGADPVAMHNHYSILYNEVVFGLLEEVRGRGEAVLFARSAHTSAQRFPVHWGGDCSSTFESMAESLRGGLSLGLCGFGFWSHDIGGFEGLPQPVIYKRWVAFGLLSSHSRLHGSSTYRVPWNYNGEACDVLRFFTKLKCRLMPYLFGAAVEAHLAGVPVLRAMLLEFPDDPACDGLDRQYLLGPSLLVAPVLSEAGTVDYYLPAGRWTHLLTGEVQAGGRWHRAQHDFLSLPLFARPGSVLPLGAVEDRPDYDFTADLTFRVFELQDGTRLTCEVPTLQGAPGPRLTVWRTDRRISATLEGGFSGRWQLQLAGLQPDDLRTPLQLAAHPLGVIITAAAGTRQIDCELASALGAPRLLSAEAN